VITLSSGANTVYVTLTEKATLGTPVYVFVFQNDNTRERFMCTTSNVSTNTARYDQFTITVQASPTWTSGQVVLSKYGFYSYFVYEVSTVVGLNYNTIIAADPETYVPTYFTSLVEKGKMLFPDPSISDTSYISHETPVKAYGD
jgi:hypothetical protein